MKRIANYNMKPVDSIKNIKAQIKIFYF